MDIKLVPDSRGWYHCDQCTYETNNRARYKMHSVIHKPRKWQCFYCDAQFPIMYVCVIFPSTYFCVDLIWETKF